MSVRRVAAAVAAVAALLSLEQDVAVQAVPTPSILPGRIQATTYVAAFDDVADPMAARLNTTEDGTGVDVEQTSWLVYPTVVTAPVGAITFRVRAPDGCSGRGCALALHARGPAIDQKLGFQLSGAVPVIRLTKFGVLPEYVPRPEGAARRVLINDMCGPSSQVVQRHR